ncbi:SDR family oxidoreductase [Candidatus Pacearchaeota archaeon]|nr:SDR family oxidoreductase [Candidatus Pacearchaeota archaeon]
MRRGRVLITGNLGYNGAAVVKKLNAEGYYTIGLDIHYFQHTFYKDDSTLPQEQIIKDIREVNDSDFQENLKEIDAVVHLAALSNDALGELNPQLTMDINKEASINLARLCKKNNIKKFIYSSSCSVYGIQDPNESATEDSPLNPLTTYAKAKVETEIELIKLNSPEFRVIIMRNATMHSISPKLRLDLVLNNLVSSAHIFKKVKILSDGSPWRPLLSITDFANIVSLFIENEARDIIYNIGFNEENYQVKDLGKMISQKLGLPLEINPQNTPDERSYKVNFSKLKTEFPRLKILKGVKESIAELKPYYEENNLSEEDFSGVKYFRIKTLKDLISRGIIDSELKMN